MEALLAHIHRLPVRNPPHGVLEWIKRPESQVNWDQRSIGDPPILGRRFWTAATDWPQKYRSAQLQSTIFQSHYSEKSETHHLDPPFAVTRRTRTRLSSRPRRPINCSASICGCTADTRRTPSVPHPHYATEACRTPFPAPHTWDTFHPPPPVSWTKAHSPHPLALSA